MTRGRVLAIGAGAVVVAIALIAISAAFSGPHHSSVAASAASTSTSTSPTVAPAEPITAITAGTTPTSQRVLTTTTVACRNSTNPACGPLVWDPPVTNQPGKLTVSLVSVGADGPGSIKLKVDDADPDSGPEACSWLYRDADHPTDLEQFARQQSCLRMGGVQACPKSFGTWVPPRTQPVKSDPSNDVVTFGLPAGRHTVEIGMLFGGTFAVSAGDGSVACNPYAEIRAARITVDVPA